MAKYVVKERSIVCMDRGYKGVLDTIYKTIFLAAGDENEQIVVRPLALEHRDKLVVKFEATDDQMDAIQDRIEDLYPGLCIFNPPMYV